MVQDFPVASLEELLGSESPNENERARSIRDKRRNGLYASEQTVAAMCSGDIHYVLRLVQRMVEDFGGIEKLGATDTVPRIPGEMQHSSIRTAAGEFIQQVRDLPRNGERLAAIVDSFGAVAHSHLMFRNSKNEGGNPPHQASRIEPYEAPSLSQDNKAILVELLRYSIFLEDPRGRSRRGNVVPRYYLRRYLIPHFWLSFSRRDSLELESEELEQLLSSPAAFERTKRLRDEYIEDPTIDMFRQGSDES
ncbi:MAG: hypothetical protein GKR94_11415 [Gammaproteobacteria bacterium]|nr:hypothetical protein [Gammaproteobacteria bacterium]